VSAYSLPIRENDLVVTSMGLSDIVPARPLQREGGVERIDI
jgi:hypothetical protein